jgi:hypothetical protein
LLTMAEPRPTLRRKLVPGVVGLVAVGALVGMANLRSNSPQAPGNAMFAEDEVSVETQNS